MVTTAQRGRASTVGLVVQVLVVAVVLLAPVLWMVLSSLKESTAVTQYPPVLFFSPTLKNFIGLFRGLPFGDYLVNSLIVAGGSTILGLVLAIPCAFAVSWHGTSWPATLTLFARMVPGTLFVLPWFVIFSKLDLIGSHWVLILTHTVVTMPLALWTLLPYFESLPRSIFESAFIDGCRGWRSLIYIGIPLALPGIAVATILAFIGSWNYFLFALVLGGTDTKTMIVASFNFIGEGATDWGRLMAAAVVIALPPLTLIFLVERGLVSGLSGSAVKG
jgi:multiple sugar transport system permease protein